VLGPDVPDSAADDARGMSNLLTVMTAQADAVRREQEVLRDLERRRRTGTSTAVRPSLRGRVSGLVLRSRRAARTA
jgi:hypothetical protein